MPPASDLDTTEYWSEAVDLAGLHACRSVADLDQELVYKLVRLFPGIDAGLCLAHEDGSQRAELVLGAGCPWRVGDSVVTDSWRPPQWSSHPLQFRNHRLGTLHVDVRPTPEQQRQLTALLAHYGVALVNLTLNEESRRATDHYCANLQALEEGIVLFQESDRGAVLARLVGLATTMLQATAGALYVLSEVGNLDSELRPAEVFGMPEELLHSFTGRDGTWPRHLLTEPPRHFERGTDPSLSGLSTDAVPAILRNLVTLPLCYHGVVAGIMVLFNVVSDHTSLPDQLARVDSLGQLGAALLHRFELEGQAVLTRSLARELQIAETIQQRLLPQQAPAHPGYDFAWRSIAAQNIGGDYLDLLSSPFGTVYALIADASGHGINSALLMSSFRSTYRAAAPWLDPSPLLHKLNAEVLAEVGATGMFITAAHLRLEPDSGRLTVSSAGHNPLLLFRRATGSIERIDSSGPPLGFVAGAAFGEQVLQLHRGDVLMLYTDGITEATDRQLEMFGEERLEQCLRRHAGGSAADILDAALAELAGFAGRSSQDDDVSLSVIKRR